MLNVKFYRCVHCGNIIVKVHDSGVPVVCCGEPMQELVPNTTDAAQEKHVPVIAADGSTITVSVGSVAHPMEDDHYIEWIGIVTDKSAQVTFLAPGQDPKAVFALAEGKVVAAFEYCNKHGLWTATC